MAEKGVRGKGDGGRWNSEGQPAHADEKLFVLCCAKLKFGTSESLAVAGLTLLPVPCAADQLTR